MGALTGRLIWLYDISACKGGKLHEKRALAFYYNNDRFSYTFKTKNMIQQTLPCQMFICYYISVVQITVMVMPVMSTKNNILTRIL